MSAAMHAFLKNFLQEKLLPESAAINIIPDNAAAATNFYMNQSNRTGGCGTTFVGTGNKQSAKQATGPKTPASRHIEARWSSSSSPTPTVFSSPVYLVTTVPAVTATGASGDSCTAGTERRWNNDADSISTSPTIPPRKSSYVSIAPSRNDPLGRH